jgi:hypothetical protein
MITEALRQVVAAFGSKSEGFQTTSGMLKAHLKASGKGKLTHAEQDAMRR